MSVQHLRLSVFSPFLSLTMHTLVPLLLCEYVYLSWATSLSKTRGPARPHVHQDCPDLFSTCKGICRSVSVPFQDPVEITWSWSLSTTNSVVSATCLGVFREERTSCLAGLAPRNVQRMLSPLSFGLLHCLPGNRIRKPGHTYLVQVQRPQHVRYVCP